MDHWLVYEEVDCWAVWWAVHEVAEKDDGTVALLAFFAVVLMVVEKAQMLVAVEVEWMVCERVVVMVA